jgi:hypothetical protein
MRLRDTLRGGDRLGSHENAIHDVPELYQRHCHKTSSTDGPGPQARPGNVLTEILFDDGGILEIYHIGRQVSETVIDW